MDYLTPRLLEEINISYAKAQVHESGKLSRIMKGKVAQASAGFASNLTGLASATLGSATSTGKYHGASDDEGSDKAAQEVTVAGAVDKGSASNIATANIDRWVSCIKSGKEGLGNGRVGDLWLGRVGNGQGKQWPWDTPRRMATSASLSVPISAMEKRRNTHGPSTGQSTRDRTSSTGHRHVSAESQQYSERYHTKRHSIHDIREPESSRRHRTKASLSHGAGQLRSMTSKTGHALRDGLSNVTSLARYVRSSVSGAWLLTFLWRLEKDSSLVISQIRTLISRWPIRANAMGAVVRWRWTGECFAGGLQLLLSFFFAPVTSLPILGPAVRTSLATPTRIC